MYGNSTKARKGGGNGCILLYGLVLCVKYWKGDCILQTHGYKIIVIANESTKGDKMESLQILIQKESKDVPSHSSISTLYWKS